MRKLYLDIDGVILTTKGSKPYADSEEYVEYITDNFVCQERKIYKLSNLKILNYINYCEFYK